MTPLVLDETAVRNRLAPLIEDPTFRRATTNLAGDRLFLSVFLMVVSLGEGLGEAGVTAIGQEEVARLMHDLRRQEFEEHGHMESARLVACELFPDLFAGGHYRYQDRLFGTDYYFTVLEANRTRLRARDRYSRLNLYMTTTFGYEIMVQLLYGAVIEAVCRSPLSEVIRERVEFVLTAILRQEDTHLGLIAQHNALLAANRSALSASACAALEQLARLDVEDYEWAAERAVCEIVSSVAVYADPAAVRAHLGDA